MITDETGQYVSALTGDLPTVLPIRKRHRTSEVSHIGAMVGPPCMIAQ